MMVSWLVAAYCTHRARYFPHNTIYWQADNEDKAAAIVDARCKWIEDHLEPAVLRRDYESWRTSSGLVGTLKWKETSSRIEGIASGPDKVRSYTPSILVMDESDFHLRGQDSLAAGLACVEKNAQLIVISSSNGPGKVLGDICKAAGFTRWKGGV
jgi:hypothetical protein